LGNVNALQGCLSSQQIRAVQLCVISQDLQAPAQKHFPTREHRSSAFGLGRCSEESGSSAADPQLDHGDAAHASPLQCSPRARSTIIVWSITGLHVALPSYLFLVLFLPGAELETLSSITPLAHSVTA